NVEAAGRAVVGQYVDRNRVAGVGVGRIVVELVRTTAGDDRDRNRRGVRRGIGDILDGVGKRVGARKAHVRRVSDLAGRRVDARAAVRWSAGDRDGRGIQFVVAVRVRVVPQNVDDNGVAGVGAGEIVVGCRAIDDNRHLCGIRGRVGYVFDSVEEAVAAGVAI